MKNWTKRFGMIAVLGSLLCGLMIAGCGGGEEAEDTGAANNAANPAAPAEDS